MDNPIDIGKMYGISSCPNCPASNTPTHLTSLNDYQASKNMMQQNMPQSQNSSMQTTQQNSQPGRIPNILYGTVNSSPMANADMPMQNNNVPSTTTQRALNGSASSSAITNAFNQAIPVTNESIQYLNGFMRSQIGRRVTIEFMVGTNTMIEKEGYLIAVGANFILLNEVANEDIIACDFYNIKFIKFHY